MVWELLKKFQKRSGKGSETVWEPLGRPGRPLKRPESVKMSILSVFNRFLAAEGRGVLQEVPRDAATTLGFRVSTFTPLWEGPGGSRRALS